MRARTSTRLRDWIGRAAVAALIGGGIVFTGTPAHAAGTASITGVVTVPAGHTVDETAIYADLYPLGHTEPWERVERKRISLDGTYAFVGIAPGTYTMQFVTNSTFAWEWWTDAPTVDGATPITVIAGQTRSGVDAALDSESVITGRVTYPAGTVTSDLFTNVLVYSADNPARILRSESVAPDGNFTIGFLPAGAYKIRYDTHDYSGTNNVVEYQWQGGPFVYADAETVAVSAPGETIDVSQDLMPGRTVSGRISGSWFTSTSASAWWTVSASNSATTSPFGHSTKVAPDGSYTIRGLVPGAYGIHVFSNPGAGEGYSASAGEWWNDSLDRASATPVDVTTALAVSGVDLNVDTVGGIAARPAIVGVPVVGGTLTVTPGAWPAGLALTYKWFANGVQIAGATSSKLAVSQAHAGKNLTAQVWAQLSDDYWEYKESASTAKVTVASTPTISGTLGVGSTLTAKTGTWSSNTTFTYRWYANGVAISGATKPTFVLTGYQKGKSITLAVTGTKPGYATVTKTSKVSVKIAVPKTPVISGTARVGSKLTAKPGAWLTGTTYTYQWYASGKAISGGTKSTYTVPSQLRGKTITVKVTGKKPGHATLSTTSAPTKKVV